jgi:hypothetical protein
MAKIWNKDGKKVLMDENDFNVSLDEFNTILDKLKPSLVGENDNLIIYYVIYKKRTVNTNDKKIIKIPTLFIINKNNYEDVKAIHDLNIKFDNIIVNENGVSCTDSNLIITVNEDKQIEIKL